MRFRPSLLLASGPRFLLAITTRGGVHRFATTDVSVAWPDGETYLFRAGLQPVTFSDEVAPLDQSPPSREISLEVDFRASNGSTWADLAAADPVHLSDATATLYLWVDGADPIAIVSGTLLEPTYGYDDEMLAFTLSEDPTEDATLFPPEDAAVSQDTWDPTTNPYDEQLEGWVYPWVFGYPGGAETNYGATPGLLVYTGTFAQIGTGKLLIGGHDSRNNDTATYTVRVFDRTGDWNISVDTAGAEDDVGRIVTLVDASDHMVAPWNGGSYNLQPGDEVWISWYRPEDSGEGGLPDAGRVEALWSALDVAAYLLRQTAIRVDWAHFQATARRLRTYRVDGYIGGGPDTRVYPWEWIQDQLLPLLPVSPCWRAGGLSLVAWDLDAAVADAVDTIDPAVAGGTLSGPITTSSRDDVVNKVVVRYQYVPYLDTYQGEQILDAGNHPLARDSAERFGEREEVVETDILWDDPTAALVADWILRSRHRPYRTATYTGLPWRYAALEPGDVILVNDAGIAWTNVVCWVTAVEIAEDNIAITAQTVER